MISRNDFATNSNPYKEKFDRSLANNLSEILSTFISISKKHARVSFTVHYNIFKHILFGKIHIITANIMIQAQCLKLYIDVV